MSVPADAPILTAKAMREAEAACAIQGTSLGELMEAAGAAVADTAWRMAAGAPILILCGPGNNGGDGYVIAEILKRSGVPVEILETLANWSSTNAKRVSSRAEIAKAKGESPSSARVIAVLIPAMRPHASISGPPELPREILAVWICIATPSTLCVFDRLPSLRVGVRGVI